MELMVSIAISTIAMGAFIAAFMTYLNQSETTNSWREADLNASTALERVIRGTDGVIGLREFSLNNTSIPLSSENAWTIRDDNSSSGFMFSKAKQVISDLDGTVLVRNVAASSVSRSKTTGQINLYVAVTSGQGARSASREYQTTIHPRNP